MNKTRLLQLFAVTVMVTAVACTSVMFIRGNFGQGKKSENATAVSGTCLQCSQSDRVVPVYKVFVSGCGVEIPMDVQINNMTISDNKSEIDITSYASPLQTVGQKEQVGLYCMRCRRLIR